MDKEKFQKSAWYRLLQVIFFLFLFLSLLLSIIIFLGNEPVSFVDNSKSSITCISGDYEGNTYPLDKNGLHIIDNLIDNLDSYSKVNARKLCAYNKINITYNSYYPDPLITNYKLNTVYGTRNSWGKAFGYSFLYIFAVIIFFWFIKRLLFFIIFGDILFKKPKRLFD